MPNQLEVDAKVLDFAADVLAGQKKPLSSVRLVAHVTWKVQAHVDAFIKENNLTDWYAVDAVKKEWSLKHRRRNFGVTVDPTRLQAMMAKDPRFVMTGKDYEHRGVSVSGRFVNHWALAEKVVEWEEAAVAERAATEAARQAKRDAYDAVNARYAVGTFGDNYIVTKDGRTVAEFKSWIGDEVARNEAERFRILRVAADVAENEEAPDGARSGSTSPA